MEQDPIPGLDEKAKIPKEREDEHITNDLIQQAGMVTSTPTEEDTDEEPPRRRQARESTVQESERPPKRTPAAIEGEDGRGRHSH